MTRDEARKLPRPDNLIDVPFTIRDPKKVKAGRIGGQAKVRKGIATLSTEQRKALSKKAHAARWNHE